MKAFLFLTLFLFSAVFASAPYATPYITADFIYWKVREDGLDYGLNRRGDDKGALYEPDFDGKPGFRAGVGVKMGHDGWDLYLKYTWLYSHFKKQRGESLEPLWVDPSSSFFVGESIKATADWDIHLNILDLEWGRSCPVSPFLTLRPFFGFKGFFIDQDYLLHYRQEMVEERIRQYQDTWGFGIRVGAQSVWFFTNNWSVYADLALTSCWTKFDVNRKDRGFSQGGGETLLFYIGYDRYTLTPILELGVGLRWEIAFSDDRYRALIQVGWEEQMWWDFNHLYHHTSQIASLGNLQMQGLSARLRFDF